jgi:hypothetical protein
LGKSWVVTFPPKATAIRWLLDKLQESNWSRETVLDYIGGEAYQRAHNAVKRLNRKICKLPPRLRLFWNGRATGVCWCIIADPARNRGKDSN